MKYRGYFKDINNKHYWVEIITNEDATSSTNIELGTPPFVVSWESGDSTLYKPIKYSQATCTVVDENLLGDIYSGKNQGTKVALYDEFLNIIWGGYVLPNTYNQPYSNAIENIEIECIDALSTLKNIDYTTIQDSKNIVSILDILCHILRTCKYYKTLYISNSNIPQYLENVVQEWCISENNFFDEDGKGMKCSEVLEELLKYLNMTMFADAENVYMIDYDAIVNDSWKETYTTVDIATNEVLTTATNLTLKNTITASNFKSADTDITIDNVYNKATVVADTYTVDKINIDFFNDKDTINTSYWEDDSEFATMDVYVGKTKAHTNVLTNPYDYKYLYYRILKHPNVTTYYYKDYDVDGVKKWLLFGDSNSVGINYGGFYDLVGATLFQYSLSEYTKFEYESAYKTVPLTPSLNFKNTILLHLNNSLAESTYLLKKEYRKLVEIQPTSTNIIANENTYLHITCNSVWRDIKRYFIGDEYKGEYKTRYDYPYLPIMIFNKNGQYAKTVVNNGWENLKTIEWHDVDDDFVPYSLPFWVESEDFKQQHLADVKNNMLDTSLNLFCNVDWRMNLGDIDGRIFKLPSGTNVADIKLVIYQPFLPSNNDTDKEVNLQCVFIENLELNVITENSNNNIKLINTDDTDSNTKYENVIDEDYIEELDEISMKVNTYDNKELSYSCVYVNNNGTLEYLDTVVNESLLEDYRMEENLIYRIVKQYSTPKIILNVILNNQYNMYNYILYPTQFPNKKFIVDSMSIDYESDASTLTLIEKEYI